MKKYVTLLCFLYAGLVAAQNVAYVSQDSILATIPTYKINLAKIDSLKTIYVEEVKLAKDKINENLQKTLASYNVKPTEDLETIKKRMNANDVSKLDLLLEEDKLIDKKVKNFDLYLGSEYTNTVQPFLDRINKAIENYAVKNKLDAVYILEQLRPSLAYFDKKKEITQVIIKALKN